MTLLGLIHNISRFLFANSIRIDLPYITVSVRGDNSIYVLGQYRLVYILVCGGQYIYYLRWAVYILPSTYQYIYQFVYILDYNLLTPVNLCDPQYIYYLRWAVYILPSTYQYIYQFVYILVSILVIRSIYTTSDGQYIYYPPHTRFVYIQTSIYISNLVCGR